jgi:hypothetical protein
MIAALIYLQFHSVKNRLVAGIKRLRRPNYLLGAIAFGIYFYFYLFVFLPRGRMRDGAATALPTDQMFNEALGALILFGIVFLAWLIPRQRAALSFSEAEVAFLFPAPISRRGLVHFKLLRSQLAILVTAVFLTLISLRSGMTGERGVMRGVAWWVILFTLNLHFIGASFALTRLMDGGLANWKRRVGLVALGLAAAAGVIGWTIHALPELTQDQLADANSLMEYFKRAMVSGPLPYLLYPFRLMLKPYLATNWLSFLDGIWPAMLLMTAHYFWVVRSDVAFEEASVEAARRLAERIASVRSGNANVSVTTRRPRRAPFTLRADGSPLVALLWKNLISAGSAWTRRTAIILLVAVSVMAFALRGLAASANWVVLVGAFSAILGIWALLIGPQIIRQDLRQDLPNADLLKVFPLRGWQIALGEILAPIVILSSIHWLLLIVTLICSGPLAEGRISGALVLAIGFGLAIVLPALNAISFVIPKGAVLLFPAWFQAGRHGPQGIEAMGQRLIFSLGQFLAFVLALIPAALVFLGVFFLLASVLGGPALAVAVASIGTALVLAVEAGLGVLWLGRLFESFDLSGEPTV